MSSGATKIVIPGFYTWANKGDAALLMSFLPWLRGRLGNIEVVVTSFTPAEDSDYFGERVIDMPTCPNRRFHLAQELVASRVPGARIALSHGRLLAFRVLRNYLTHWAVVFLRAPRLARLLVTSSVYRVAEEIQSADAVITVPGGYLNAYRVTNDWWLFHLPTLWLAAALGKRPILGPCSLGPFDERHQREARHVLSLAQLILVREQPSYDVARKLGVPASRIRQTPDMAFAFEHEDRTSEGDEVLEHVRRLASGRQLVGVSVRDHNYPGHSDPESMQHKYLDAIVEALLELQQTHDAYPVILPQTEEDQALGRELQGRLHQKQVEVCNVTANLGPSDLQSIYAQLRLLIGTRMHANILAMGAGTVVAAIAYEPKTTGILRAMGLDDWGIAIDAVAEGALAKLALAQWQAATDLGDVAKQRAAEQKMRLAEAADLLATAMGQPR
ncbi:polysaccharide pyruvyl transferase family protein [Microvirga sp. 0TCS3.31]